MPVLAPAFPWVGRTGHSCKGTSFPALTPSPQFKIFFDNPFVIFYPSGEDVSLNMLRMLPFAKEVIFISMKFRCIVSFRVKRTPCEVNIPILNSFLTPLIKTTVMLKPCTSF